MRYLAGAFSVLLIFSLAPAAAQSQGLEIVMANRTAKPRWSFADDRRLIQLAASLKSLEAVADEMKRSPANVARMAKRLGVSLKRGAGLKAKK